MPIHRAVYQVLIVAGLLMETSAAQSIAPFRVQVKAVDRNGDELPKARIAMVPVPKAATPVPYCVYPFCERVLPGRYTLMVRVEDMVTVEREILVSPHDRVLFAEMAPAVFFEHMPAAFRSVVATVSVTEDQRLNYAVKMIGILNGTARSEPVLTSHVEFPEVETGRYLLLLLRDGRVVACSTLWHDSGKTSREPLVSGDKGCELRP